MDLILMKVGAASFVGSQAACFLQALQGLCRALCEQHFLAREGMAL